MGRSRRDVLALSGAALPLLAGCTGGGGSDPTGTATETPTETRTETPTATATGAASVDDVTVTPSLVALTTPDSISTLGARDEQFVVAAAAAPEGGPAFDSFSLAAGGSTHEPTPVDDVAGYGSLWRDRETVQQYAPGSAGVVPFSLPKPLDASEATVSWPGGEHALPAAARLARPPTEFAVRGLEAPDDVASGEAATITLTVENVGDAPGTFVGGLNRIGPDVAYTPVRGVRVSAESGATATWTHEYEVRAGSAEFRLNWRGETASVTVATGTAGTDS